MAINVSTILWTVGALALIESLVVLIFPKWTIRTTKKLLKNRKKLQKIAFFELILAIVLGVIALSV